MSYENRDAEIITLGSGDLLIKKWSDSDPPNETSFTDDDIIGFIQGGATLEYKPSFYEAKDDSGSVAKILVSDEETILKSGVMTWNGNRLKSLCAAADVTEDEGVRIVRIGGADNADGASYALCFHHHDETDGDIWIILRGVNQNGFEMTFDKTKETVIDAEFKCMPQDKYGVLISYVEQATPSDDIVMILDTSSLDYAILG